MKTIIAFVLSLLIPAFAYSCPRIDGQIDYDCNGNLKMVFFGDSIVYGLKGSPSGGYVSRLQGRFPNAELINNGIPGITTLQLLSDLKRGRFPYSDVLEADYVFVAAGTNDYWSDTNPSYVANNLKRIKDQIKGMYKLSGLRAPIIKIMTLTPTTRSYQKGFVGSVNLAIRQYRLTGPDMYRLSTSLLSDDGLHPSSTGYSALSNIVYSYINEEVKAEALRRQQKRGM